MKERLKKERERETEAKEAKYFYGPGMRSEPYERVTVREVLGSLLVQVKLNGWRDGRSR